MLASLELDSARIVSLDDPSAATISDDRYCEMSKGSFDPVQGASKARDEVVAAKELYTSKVDAYVSFNRVFLSAKAYGAYFAADRDLRPGLRIMNAGCGTGDDTLALVRALTSRGLGYQRIDAFDLTPAMLARFQESLNALRIANVHVREANVLNLESLPDELSTPIEN